MPEEPLSHPIASLRRLLDSAAAKTSSCIAFSELQLEKARLRSELRMQYEALGKAQYFAEVGDRQDPASLQTLTEAITAKRAAYEALCAKHPSEPTVTCPFCGKRTPAGLKNCKDCGEPINENEK